jgi:hypothetical protein
MGTLWADFHLVEGREGFTFYEDKERLTFASSSAIRVLNSFWQLQQAPEGRKDGQKGNSSLETTNED